MTVEEMQTRVKLCIDRMLSGDLHTFFHVGKVQVLSYDGDLVYIRTDDGDFAVHKNGDVSFATITRKH